jgi:hypothetical protein
MVCPEGLVAANFSSPIHFTDALCIGLPAKNKDNKLLVAGCGWESAQTGSFIK